MKENLNGHNGHSLCKEIVLDIDQTLVDGLPKLHRLMNIIGSIYEIENLPSLEEVLTQGGTYFAYKHIDGARGLNDYINSSKRFYHNHPPVPGAVEGVKSITNHVFRPVAYLTARPESLNELSIQELMRQGFPPLPIIGKPDNLDNSEVSAWKFNCLQDFASQTAGDVVMIDDSISTARYILNEGHPQIKPIIFKGPITDPNRAPEGAMLSDWASMLGTVERL